MQTLLHRPDGLTLIVVFAICALGLLTVALAALLDRRRSAPTRGLDPYPAGAATTKKALARHR
jgi:hypothetical protein